MAFEGKVGQVLKQFGDHPLSHQCRYSSVIEFGIEVIDVSKHPDFEINLEPELSEQLIADVKAFLQVKVDSARVSMCAGDGLTNEEVEAEFAARRARVVIQTH